MREPFWWFSLAACVIAVFAQCASARQQSQDLAARPIHNEAPATGKEAPVTGESPNGTPAARETGSRHGTLRKEAPAARYVAKETTATSKSQNHAPAAHESRDKASCCT